MRLSILVFLLIFSGNVVEAQKVLQLEKFGKAKTKKLYLGETIFIQTKQNPDWFEGVIDDLLPDAQAIVFVDRIVTINDITAVRFRKHSFFRGLGRSVQLSGVVPATYEIIYGAFNPPIEWEGLAYFVGSSFAVGSLMRLIPPKKYKFGEGKRRRLRILDLTFYTY